MWQFPEFLQQSFKLITLVVQTQRVGTWPGIRSVGAAYEHTHINTHVC